MFPPAVKASIPGKTVMANAGSGVEPSLFKAAMTILLYVPTVVGVPLRVPVVVSKFIPSGRVPVIEKLAAYVDDGVNVA
jgi:hypothetical protein